MTEDAIHGNVNMKYRCPFPYIAYLCSLMGDRPDNFDPDKPEDKPLFEDYDGDQLHLDTAKGRKPRTGKAPTTGNNQRTESIPPQVHIPRVIHGINAWRVMAATGSGPQTTTLELGSGLFHRRYNNQNQGQNRPSRRIRPRDTQAIRSPGGTGSHRSYLWNPLQQHHRPKTNTATSCTALP